MDPQFALAYMRLGDQYGLQGDLRRASEVGIKVDELQSRLPRYEQLSVQILKANRARDVEAQLAARQQLVSEFPRETMDRGILGAIMGALGQQDQALDLIRRGLALDPKSEDLLNFESYQLAQRGDTNGALTANDSYMVIRPGDPNPLDTRGDILYMAGRDDEAVAEYRKVLELKPDFSDYGEYLKLAIVYTDQKKPDVANAAFQQYANHASPLSRLYVPGYQAQFKQTGGDLEGAIAELIGKECSNWGSPSRTRLRQPFCEHSPPCLCCWERFLPLFPLLRTEAQRRGTANGRSFANHRGKFIRRTAKFAALRLQPSLGRASVS